MARWLTHVAIVALFCVLVLGAVASGQERVEVWSWWDPTPQVMAELEEYVGAEVVHRNVPYGEFLETLIIGLAGGSSPDVIYINMDWFDSMVDHQALLDLNPYLQRNPTGLPMDDFFPTGLELWQVDGHQFAISNTVSPSLTWYNRDMLFELGLADPNDSFDWAQWLEYGRRATRDLDGDGLADRKGLMDWWGHFANLIWSNGGEIFSDGQLAIDSPQVEEAVYFYKQFYDLEILTMADDLAHIGYGNSEAAWSNGYVLFAPGGDWIAPTTVLDRSTGEWTFEPGVAHVPRAPGGGRVGEASSTGLAIPSGSKSPDLAWKVISYFLDDVGQSTLATDGLLPVRHSIATSSAYLPNDIYPFDKQVIIESLAYQRGPDQGVQWSQTYSSAGSPIKVNFRAFWNDEASYSEALENIRTEVSAILAQNR